MTIVTKHFRDLSPEEIYEILRLRAEVFVVEQTCVYQDLDGNDTDAWHCYIKDGQNQTVGCCRVFKYSDKYCQIGRVVTAKRVRGQGYGAQLMLTGIDLAAEHYPAMPIMIHAQSYATGFYERFGFEISSEEFLEDDIPHHEMTRPAKI